MDSLFTFSSQQFQMLAPHLPASHSLRKKIISNIGIKRQSSIQSDSTAPELRQSKDAQKSAFKKVVFDLTPLPELKNQDIQAENYLEENSKKLDKTIESSSKRYILELENKRSLELERLSCFDRKNQLQKESFSLEVQHLARNQRRIKSLRLAPKILVPLSDRKLPKAFKMMVSDNRLPPLLIEKQANKRLAQNLQIRETFSSQKARVLLNYGGELAKINKKQFMEEKRETTVQ